MGKYYFTYEGDLYNRAMGKKPRRQPFKGGWTEIEAANSFEALVVFTALHPELHDGDVCGYDGEWNEEDFRARGIAEKGINGYGCVERVTRNHTILESSAVNVG